MSYFIKKMTTTKIIALDIYGTVLATDDPENRLPLREGTLDFLERCKELGIKVISSSDADICGVMTDLGEKGIDLEKLIHRFIQFRETPKEFGVLLAEYKITPEGLFVIGDSLAKDIAGARAIGANYYYVPEYYDAKGSFNINTIKIP